MLVAACVSVTVNKNPRATSRRLDSALERRRRAWRRRMMLWWWLRDERSGHVMVNLRDVDGPVSLDNNTVVDRSTERRTGQGQ